MEKQITPLKIWYDGEQKELFMKISKLREEWPFAVIGMDFNGGEYTALWTIHEAESDKVKSEDAIVYKFQSYRKS